MDVLKELLAELSNNKKELQKLDQHMLTLNNKRGYLKENEIIPWLSFHFTMWIFGELMLYNRPVFSPKNNELYLQHYKDREGFEVISDYLEKHPLSENGYEKVWARSFHMVQQTGILNRVKIGITDDGWTITNKFIWNIIYKTTVGIALSHYRK